MRTAILTTVLAVSLLVQSACAARTFHIVEPLNSVQALQHDSLIFCTAFSINEAEGIWATAQHCVRAADAQEWEMKIHGVRVITIYRDAGHDLALVQGDVYAPALPFALRAPARGAVVEVRGFPYGFPGLVITHGAIAARMIPLKHQPLGMIYNDILDLTVAGGNSGSPVLESGYVVGILWGGFTRSPHSISVPWEVIKRAIGHYWEQPQ
jgi:S1-C subfamily serine protease